MPPAPSGTFTATGLLCATGTFKDMTDRASAGRVVFDRILTCGDGSGTITIRGQGTQNVINGSSSWQIREGTGDFASLRGKGTGSSVATGSETYRDTWQGIADFDNTAPSIRIDRLSALRLQRSPATYTLKVAFTSRDDVQENAVSYRIAVVAELSQLVAKSGQLSSASSSFQLKVRPPKGVRRVQVAVTVSDPLDNSRVVTASVKLPAV